MTDQSFRTYETDRIDFTYLIEVIYDHVVDEFLTDSRDEVIGIVRWMREEGYNVRVTDAATGISVQHPDDEGYLYEHPWPPKSELLDRLRPIPALDYPRNLPLVNA